MSKRMKPVTRWITVRADGEPAGGETLYRHKVDMKPYLHFINEKGAFGPYRAARVLVREVTAPKKAMRSTP